MGKREDREDLQKGINRLFSSKNIETTARRLKKKLKPRGDFLDISKELGLLEKLDGGNFERYRKKLKIPLLIQQVLTITYREALFHTPKPTPMRIRIKPGRRNSVDVDSKDQLISVVLTRPEPR